MHASELWEDPGIGPTLARIALSPLSLVYALGWEAYLGIYGLGLKKASKPHSPIVCVGNLVSGGSGKTPVTLHLVDLLRELGHKVVVSGSGYGSPRSEAATIAPNGDLDPAIWGDEAALFRHVYPDLPLIVGRRRVLAAELCHQSFPDSVLLLDDGFQHLPLKKDLSLILDPEMPKNRLCLPAGPYREPRWNRNRADLVIPGEFRIAEVAHLTDVSGNPIDYPYEVHLLCAIGQPMNVLVSLEKLGAYVDSNQFLPDHDRLDAGNLVESLPIDVPTVVTAKDWVKLRNRADVGEREFLILEHSVTIEPEADFKAWLKKHLDGIQEANLSR